MGKKKSGALRLPKRIAGVKIPKKVRKGDLAGVIASPAGKALIAEVVMLAGAAMAGKESTPGSKTRRALADPGQALGKAGETAAAAGAGAAGAAGDASARLTYAFGEAARAFRQAMTRPAEDRSWESGPAAELEPVEASASKKT